MTFSAHTLAFIEGVGGPELMMIMLIVLVLFGGKKLPEFARGLGKSMREFKKAASGVEEEIRRAMDEPPPAPPAPPVRTAVPAAPDVAAVAALPAAPASPVAPAAEVPPGSAVPPQPQT
ncbi:twin-arginine translocase TatA/TatE family subunit [Horticoccus luteus]|uniref:Sec-independent protein translocase protein TatA n=1 Tax=Horticoccus luteus TaxID=2862869 RepID=A0A8F9TUC3_9BACT|nr:twin-arginine translocase TatA/TatE family subunit [Horticoccus luteus]